MKLFFMPNVCLIFVVLIIIIIIIIIFFINNFSKAFPYQGVFDV